MQDAGLSVETDAGANLIGRLPGASSRHRRATASGTARGPGAIVTGSHTDTVQGGGRYDGIIGVLGAIEAVRCLRQSGTELDHDLVVVDFLGEEPNDFGLSCLGSRAIVGALDEEHLALVDPDGRSLAEALEASGGQPAALATARWQPRLHCYIELHIEQGPVLEQARIPIGVVTGIVGIHRLLARITGQPDHSGTTPMESRRDAFLGAAEMALAIERLATDALDPVGSGGVATTGRLEIRPGAHNVVPAEADLWAEARSADNGWLDEFGRRVAEELDGIGARRRLGTSLGWVSRVPPVPVTGWVATAIEQAARSQGIEPLRIPSGAGHDASHMARLGPMGMVFVPSRAGRSHCPEEWTDVEDIGRGISVLAETMVICDHREEAAPGEAVQEAT
jgi:N-carbamoyl-L-amino-acid hydrolase